MPAPINRQFSAPVRKAVQIRLRSPFKSRSAIVARLWARLISVGVRAALGSGYVVVIEGAPATGKSFILEAALPGRVIGTKASLQLRMHEGRPELRSADIPQGSFGVDEFQAFDQKSVVETLSSIGGRSFALALQRKSDLRHTLDSLLPSRRRIEVSLV